MSYTEVHSVQAWALANWPALEGSIRVSRQGHVWFVVLRDFSGSWASTSEIAVAYGRIQALGRVLSAPCD
jgi:hypothetical protein